MPCRGADRGGHELWIFRASSSDGSRRELGRAQAAFADDAETRDEGHSFEFTELHNEYLRLFEKATERVLEVARGAVAAPWRDAASLRAAYS